MGCRVSGLCFVGTVSTRLNWISRPYGRTTIDVLEGLNRNHFVTNTAAAFGLWEALLQMHSLSDAYDIPCRCDFEQLCCRL